MIDHKARAKKAWPYLAKRANAKDNTYTYKELTDKLGLHHRAASWFLGVIQEYCDKKGWPPIQALVVNKRTKLPGSGYHGSKINKKSHAIAIKKVHAKKWNPKPPNF